MPTESSDSRTATLARRLVERFRGFAARPPSAAHRVVMVLVGVALTVQVWRERGLIAGTVALVAYGAVFTAVALRHDRETSWSARHPVLDSFLFAPLVFLAAAMFTDLALVICAVIGLAAWVVLLLVFKPHARRATHAASRPS